MGVVILLVLAAVWVAVLIPPIVRARADIRPTGSVSDFHRQLQVLARTTPYGPSAHSSLTYTATDAAGPLYRFAPRMSPRQRSIRRRRDILVGLAVGSLGSLVLGFLPAFRVLWFVHLGADVLLAGYIGALIYMRNAAAERAEKVRFLPNTSQHPEPALLLRRSAN